MSRAAFQQHVPFPLRFAGRTVRIAALSFSFLFAFFLGKWFGTFTGPRLLRWYLQSCGAAFVKLGQILAMRFDLLPIQYCEELSKLLDRLPAIPTERIVAVIERDLGRPVEECFATFEVDPIAAASVAQVHAATLADGTPVVVKVLRPGITERFRIDLLYLRMAGPLLNMYGPFVNIDMRRMFGEVVRLTREELDFRREARQIQQMHERMNMDDIDHYAPRVYPELCGRAVITMERIEGVSVTTMLAAVEARDEERLSSWAAAGITPQRTARILMRSILEQSLRHRLFHADPHAANLIVMAGGTLGWVDFGMVGWIDERLWVHQFKIREAVSNGHIHAAYQHLLATLEPIPTTDLSSFETEAKEYFRDWLASSESNMATLAEKSSGYFFLRLLDAVRRAGLSLPAGLMRLYRTIIIGDIVMLKLDPRIDWVPVLREFVADEQRRLTATLFGQTFSAANFNTAWQFLIDAPRMALEVADTLQFRLASLGQTQRQMLTRAQRLLLHVLKYIRLAALLFAVPLLVRRLGLADLFEIFGWSWLSATTGTSSGTFLIFDTLLVLLMGRLIHELERPEPR